MNNLKLVNVCFDHQVFVAVENYEKYKELESKMFHSELSGQEKIELQKEQEKMEIIK